MSKTRGQVQISSHLASRWAVAEGQKVELKRGVGISEVKEDRCGSGTWTKCFIFGRAAR